MKALWLTAAAMGLAVGVAGIAPAFAQKTGGTLRIYHRDNPPSASIHEEATVSTVLPFMAVYNNLVVYDQQKKLNNMDTIVPDLAKSWEWDATKTKLTFKLVEGVKWHDGKPFTAADVKCTFDLLQGKGKQQLRKNPRAIWFRTLKEVTTNGAHEATFNLERPQPAFIALLASGYTPIYPCHVSPAEMRTKPVGTGPFKFAEFKGNEVIRLTKNPDYFKKGKPLVDAIEMRIIQNRSTRILAFQAGEFDMTFSQDVTIPLLKDMVKQAPKAICEVKPQYVHRNLIVNREAAPFDNAKIRTAMALALDRKAFIDILTEGKGDIGGAMLPLPEGQWGMPPSELAKMTGYTGDIAKNRAEARKIMEGLGYSASNPLKVKIATRNIAIYRDPAVILIDQLKQIYIDAELEPIDTTIWYNKVQQKQYQVGLNLTGAGLDDPDGVFYENFYSTSDRNYTGYKNPEVDKMIDQQSAETDVAKRKVLVGEIERVLLKDAARPPINHGVANTCWAPTLKNLVLQHNSIYNGWRLEEVWLDK
jgi:peptide/nickel transport system substrate-binding protein